MRGLTALISIMLFLVTPQLAWGQILHTLQPSRPLKDAYHSENYTWTSWATKSDVVSAITPNRITVWSAEKVEGGFKEILDLEVTTHSRGDVSTVALSASGDKLVYLDTNARTLKVVALPSGEELKSVEAGSGGSLCMSRDGELVAVQNWDDGTTIRVFSLKNSEWLADFKPRLEEFRSMSFLGNTHKLAISGKDPRDGGNVKVFDADSGKEIAASRWQKNIVTTLGTTQDATTLVAGTWDDPVKVLDVRADGISVRHSLDVKLTMHVRVSEEGGRVVVAARNHGLSLWDAETGKQTTHFPCEEVACISLSPSGAYAVVKFDALRHPVILDLESLKSSGIEVSRHQMRQQYEQDLVAFNFDASGKQVAFKENTNAIDFFDVDAGKLDYQIAQGNGNFNGNEISGAAVSDKLDVLYLHDTEIRLYSVSSKTDKVVLRFPESFKVNHLFWTDSGNFVVCAYQRADKQLAELFVLDRNGERKDRIKTSLPYEADACNISPDNRWLVYSRSSTFYVIDRDKDVELGQFSVRDGGKKIWFSPDSRYVILGPEILDVTTGEIKPVLPIYGRFRVADVSKKGNLMAVGKWESGNVHIFDYLTGKHVLKLEQSGEEISGLAISPNLETLAAGTESGKLLLWKLPKNLAAEKAGGAPVLVASSDFKGPLEMKLENGLKLQISSEGSFDKADLEKALREALSRVRSGELDGN